MKHHFLRSSDIAVVEGITVSSVLVLYFPDKHQTTSSVAAFKHPKIILWRRSDKYPSCIKQPFRWGKTCRPKIFRSRCNAILMWWAAQVNAWDRGEWVWDGFGALNESVLQCTFVLQRQKMVEYTQQFLFFVLLHFEYFTSGGRGVPTAAEWQGFSPVLPSLVLQVPICLLFDSSELFGAAHPPFWRVSQHQ